MKHLSLQIVSLAIIALAVIHFAVAGFVEKPPEDYFVEVAQGNIAGTSSELKFGHNPLVGATMETVWSGSNLYLYMTVADQLEILSSNDEDGGAGGDTGALTLQIFCLDSDYLRIDETVTLNGTTVVTTTMSCLRVYRAIVRSTGSTDWNIGTLTIRDQDTDVTRALVDPFVNQTLMAVYPVAANETAYVTSWYASTSSNKATEVSLFVRPFEEVFQVKSVVDLILNVETIHFDIPFMVAARSDIEIRAIVPGAGGDVDGGFDMVLVEN